MTRPPAFGVSFRRTITLGAYVKPHSQRYCTRPLSTLKITIVKQMEQVDIFSNQGEKFLPKLQTRLLYSAMMLMIHRAPSLAVELSL
jgi:hypothetical protein